MHFGCGCSLKTFLYRIISGIDIREMMMMILSCGFAPDTTESPTWYLFLAVDPLNS